MLGQKRSFGKTDISIDSLIAALQAGTPTFSELHVALFDMFRIARRTVDYATKAYESQRLEYKRCSQQCEEYFWVKVETVAQV